MKFEDMSWDELVKVAREMNEQIEAIGGGGVKGKLMPGAAHVSADREILMRGIVRAGQQAGIIRSDLEAVSVPECLHILDCLAKPCAPVSAEPVALNLDQQRLVLWQAINSIKIGNKWDDELILRNLHEAGYVIYSYAPVASQAQPEHCNNGCRCLAQCGDVYAYEATKGSSNNHLPKLPLNDPAAAYRVLHDYGQSCARAALAQQDAKKADKVLLNALKGLLEYAERLTCLHENTRRGGVIWEICDDCGAKWADDKGVKPAFEWPQEIRIARALIEASGKDAGQ